MAETRANVARRLADVIAEIGEEKLIRDAFQDQADVHERTIIHLEQQRDALEHLLS